MKKIIFPIVAVGLMFATATTLRTTQFQVKAEEETSEVLEEDTSDLEEVELEETDEITIKEWFQNQYDTLVVPIISGVTITSVMSALVSITFAIFNRKTNKKIKLSNEQLATLSLSILDSATKLITEIKNTNDLSVVTKDTFVNVTNSIIEQVAELSGKTENLIALKSSIYTLAELVCEIACSTKNMVANGTAENCKKLLEQIKDI